MNPRAWAATLVTFLWPVAAGAQQISGLAAWTIGRGANAFDTQSYPNTGFSQHYVLGTDWPFIDARLMKLSTQGSFRTTALTSGAKGAERSGDQRAVGYRLGAALFPLRSFPLTVQASRDIVDESADYPSSSAIRGGVALPIGEILQVFQTTNRALSANWQIRADRLPRVDLSYAKDRTDTAGSIYGAGQQQRNMHANVVKESPRVRHAFRYDRTATDNFLTRAYNQRNNDMDYEFGALVGARSRMRIHSGRRRSYSLFDLPAPIVGPSASAHSVPSSGESGTRYVTSSITFEPVSRFSVDATGSLDRQEAAPAATSARLVTTSARLEVGGGLSLDAAGTYGDREQVISDRTIAVVTRSGQAGSTFRAGPHWLEGTLTYRHGVGSNQTPEKVFGSTRTWTGQAALSSTIRWVGLSVGRDRSSARDDLLDYGNADVQRDRASLQVLAGRVTVQGSWDDAVIDRGRDSTFASLWQRSASGSASLRVTRSSTITANGGGFTNIGLSGTDTTRFWGGAINVEPAAGLHLSAWIRQEEATATQTRLDRKGLGWLGLVEYQLRDFTMALEYRRTDEDLRSDFQVNRYGFRGRQLNLRISRKLLIRI
jgi:hypothetical protein